MQSGTFQLRTYRRIPVQCAVYFSNHNVQATGNLWNLSVGGCRVDGNTEVRPGMIFCLLLILGQRQQSIIVEQATVTWARGREFGLRINRIHTSDAKQLQQLVTSQIS